MNQNNADQEYIINPISKGLLSKSGVEPHSFSYDNNHCNSNDWKDYLSL